MCALTTAKNAFRKEMKSKLMLLSKEDIERQSSLVVQELLNSSAYKKCSRISLYLSMADEVQTSPILKDSLASGKKCFVPRYKAGSSYMDMVLLHSWQDFESLPLTKWGIKQPSLEDKREDALATGGLDLILVPGLAFTPEGHRMGRGKGYYDVFLTTCKSTLSPSVSTIALALEEQMISSLPHDNKDVPVDTVLTCNSIYGVQL